MPKKKTDAPAAFIQTWTLSSAATLGSSVRAKGILLELRAQLPASVRKSLDVSGAVLTLAMAAVAENEFRSAVQIVANVLANIESLPVIPREIENILAISTSERRRWLEDGRLKSAGTRTVRLQGRARQITFHVYDPRFVEELLNSGAVDQWREDDVVAKAENRRRAAYTAKLKRSLKKQGANQSRSGSEKATASPELAGWDEFDRDGILR